LSKPTCEIILIDASATHQGLYNVNRHLCVIRPATLAICCTKKGPHSAFENPAFMRGSESIAESKTQQGAKNTICSHVINTRLFALVHR
jgi:hypothetical protein